MIAKQKVLIIGTEVKPIPAVKGGAVELLIDHIVNDNEKNNLIDFTIISPFDCEAAKQASTINNASFLYIKSIGLIKNIINFVDLFSRKFLKKSFGNYYIRKICNNVDFNKYDTIIVENRPLFGIQIRKKYKGQLFLHLHNDFINSNTIQVKEIINSFDKIIVISNYLKDRIESFNPKCISVIYNGIDLNKYTSLTNYTTGIKRIIYSGRLVKEKGVLELIQAFNQIKDKDVELDIIGDYDYNSENEDIFIKKFNKAINNNDKIHLLGYVDNSDIYKYYEEAYIGVVPTIVNEALSLSAIELLASGLPVICTNVGGLKEVVDEKCGILINKENLIEELKSSILNLIDNKEKRDLMSQYAKSKSLFFSNNNYINNFYKEIINK